MGWVDTWCIDQKDSTELSEAINSMYQWYREADVCYAFLHDVDGNASDVDDKIKESRWFTRGWTLQELIAPEVVIFYDNNWRCLGSKTSKCDLIASITKIHDEALVNKDLREFSIAQKMSWAAMRKTKKREDEAYCLMGLFGVNMPLIYGEGKRAFERLQEEILRHSRDHTIFAWSTKALETTELRLPILAPSPQAFRFSKGIVTCKPHEKSKQSYIITNKKTKSTYTITNNGIEIYLSTVPKETLELRLPTNTNRDIIDVVGFNCRDMSEPNHSYLAIVLLKDSRDSFVKYRYGRDFGKGGIHGANYPTSPSQEPFYLATKRTHSLKSTKVRDPHVYWLRQSLQQNRFRIRHSSPGRWHEKEEVDMENDIIVDSDSDSDIMMIEPVNVGLTIEDLEMRVRLFIAFEVYNGNNSTRSTKRILTWKEVEDTQSVSYDKLLKSGKETADDFLSTELRDRTIVCVTFVPGLKNDRRGYWIDLSASPQ